MKKLLLITALLCASQANATVLCQSLKDPTFKAYFEGYTCPTGYFQILR